MAHNAMDNAITTIWGITMDLHNLVTLKEWCAANGTDYKRARRLAKRGKFPNAVMALGRYAIPADAPVYEMPDAKRGGFRVRDDGRSRYNVYMTTDEHDGFVAAFPECDVVDPRVARKERRDARKAAANADDGK